MRNRQITPGATFSTRPVYYACFFNIPVLLLSDIADCGCRTL